MRDFRDAKAMAHSLRDALKSKAIQTTHSESLELIAKAFGYDNWNILSAKIDDAQVRLNAILEKLPRARGHNEPDNQLDLLEPAQHEVEAESDATRHGENA